MTVQAYQQVPAALQNGVRAPSPGRKMQGVSFFFHGWFKTGKSSLAVSGPPPVLVLDAETASFWTPGRKVQWDPRRETCPADDGTWDICIVIIHTLDELKWMLSFLTRGQHPFNSLSMDSVSNIQERVMRELAGTAKLEREQWYALLREINGIIAGYRDLITHPYRPVWAVSFVSGTHWDAKMRKFRPLLAGQASDYIPYVPDVEGWIDIRPDGTHHLFIGPSPVHETGNRLWNRLPDDMQLGTRDGSYPGWTVESMVWEVLSKS